MSLTPEMSFKDWVKLNAYGLGYMREKIKDEYGTEPSSEEMWQYISWVQQMGLTRIMHVVDEKTLEVFKSILNSTAQDGWDRFCARFSGTFAPPVGKGFATLDEFEAWRAGKVSQETKADSSPGYGNYL